MWICAVDKDAHMEDGSYKRLAEHLDALPNGFPPTEDGVELRLLAKLFTPDEAALAAQLRLTLETVPQIAARIGQDDGGLRKALKGMARKGLITAGRTDRGLGYASMPFVVGIYEMQAGRIILATGWQSYPAGKMEDYGYREEADVVTNVEFEQILASCGRENRKLARPSDGRIPARIAFVQCAGSRDINHLPYCSAVCCSASVKHALTLRESHPGIQCEVFYIDLRLTGRNEKLLMKAESSDTITFTKGKVGRILHNPEGEGLVLEVEDIMAGKKRSEIFDMVVLATGLVPCPPIPGLATNEYGFYLAGQIPGIFPAATCKRPMDVSTSVKDATAAALKTMKNGNG